MAKRTTWAVAWTLLVLVACWFPRDRLPVDEGRSHRWRPPNADKLVHVAMFAGFGLLWMRARPRPSQAARVLVGGLALAVISELGQELPVVHRDADVLDALADAIGVGLGIAAALRLGRGRDVDEPAATPGPAGRAPGSTARARS
ncbi:MAG TPA: VanZ family protein [Isosphaeraceae bacterium]|jgi:hypothetical protein|nr:VanZ family protein [Isosphaeraceae bacterium]